MRNFKSTKLIFRGGPTDFCPTYEMSQLRILNRFAKLFQLEAGRHAPQGAHFASGLRSDGRSRPVKDSLQSNVPRGSLGPMPVPSKSAFSVNGRSYQPPARSVVVICLDGTSDEYLDAAMAR